jgi:FkbM family methyltransferase
MPIVSRLLSKSALSRLLRVVSIKHLLQSSATKRAIINSIIWNTPIVDGNFVLSNYGVWLTKNWQDRTFRLSILGYRNNLEKFLAKIKHDVIFLDIGANQGVFSLVAAKNRFIQQIHSFEPNLEIAALLRKNLNFSGAPNFILHAVAISNQEGSVNFSFNGNHSGGGHLTEGETGVEVRSVNFHYLNEVFHDLKFPIVIKIDVEGFEKQVLTELFKSDIQKNITHIFIEMNHSFGQVETVDGILQQSGFRELWRKGSEQSYDALYVNHQESF